MATFHAAAAAESAVEPPPFSRRVTIRRKASRPKSVSQLDEPTPARAGMSVGKPPNAPGPDVALTLLRKPDTGLRASVAASVSGMPRVGKLVVKSPIVTEPVAVSAQLELQLSKERLSQLSSMLQSATADEEKYQQEYLKVKTPKNHSRLVEAKKIVESLRVQVHNAAALVPQEMQGGSPSGAAALPMMEVTQKSRLSQTSLDVASDTDLPMAAMSPASFSQVTSSTTSGEARGASGTTEGGVLLTGSSCDDREPALCSWAGDPVIPDNAGHDKEGEFVDETKPGMAPGANSIISMEDDDFPGESLNANKDHGPFNNLEVLKTKHAHCSVFLTYLSSNGDPAALLFHLVTDVYMQGSLKDMKKWAYEIHSTFLVNNAPLHVPVDEGVVLAIDGILDRRVDKEDVMRSLFVAARLESRESIVRDLAEFRSKRDLGLDNMFSDGELYDVDMDRATELRVVERRLKDLYDKFKNDSSPKGECMAYSLVALMKDWGLPKLFSGGVGSVLPLGSGGNGLERVPSLLMKDKSKLGSLFGRFRKESVKNHGFAPQVYQSTTYCDVCKMVMWGVGFQGLHCQACEMNVHKECLNRVEVCQKKRKPSRSAVVANRKTSAATGTAGQPPIAVSTYGGLTVYAASTGALSAGGEGKEQAPAPSPNAATKPDLQDPVPPPPPGHTGSHSVSSIVKRFEQDTSQASSAAALPQLPSQSAQQPSSGETFDTLHQGMGGGSAYTSQASVASAGAASSSGFGSTGLSPASVGSGLVGRSESFTDKTSSQDAPTTRNRDARRSRSDVDQNEEAVLQGIASTQLQLSSSSTSSIASAKSDSGTSETSANADLSSKIRTSALIGDPDLDVESEMPLIETLVSKEQLRKLKPKERKRQEILNELFYTERSHVRNLKLLEMLFHVPMSLEQAIPSDFTKLLFSNIGDVIAVHSALNDAMRKRYKENPLVMHIGDLLVEKMDGAAGERMKEVCAEYCQEHKLAGETLKQRRRRDTKLQEIIQTGESHPYCRRLQLHDLLIAEVQRLTKYPLLIDSLLKYTSETTDKEEYDNLQKASHLSEAILAHVNNAVKAAEDLHTLAALQKRLDTSSLDKSTLPHLADFKNLDLTKHRLIYSGHLSWRLTGRKPISLHAVLLKDLLVLLQMQDDNRLVLKCQETQTVVGKEDVKAVLSPVLRVSGLLARAVATDKKAFFVIDMSEQSRQMYNFAAPSADEKRRWTTYITDAAESLKDPSRLAAMHAQMRVKQVLLMPVEPASSSSEDGAISPGTLPVVQEDVTPGEAAASDVAIDADDGEVGGRSELSPDGVESAPRVDATEPPARDATPRDSREGDELDVEHEPLESLSRLIQEQDAAIAQALAEKKQLASMSQHDGSSDDRDDTANETQPHATHKHDPQTLIVASISDAVKLEELLSAGGSGVAMACLTPAAATAASAAAAILSRRLTSLLDAIMEKEAESLRLQEQLSQAQYVLGLQGLLPPGDRLLLLGDCDSRPLSYVSNSSDFVSGDETYARGPELSSRPADRVSQLRRNSSSSAAEDELADDDDEKASDARAAEAGSGSAQHSELENADSDDEGTVYADAVEDGSSSVQPKLRATPLPRTSESANEGAMGTDDETLRGDCDFPLDASPGSSSSGGRTPDALQEAACPVPCSPPSTVSDSVAAAAATPAPGAAATAAVVAPVGLDGCGTAARGSVSSDYAEAMSASNTTSDSLEYNDAQTGMEPPTDGSGGGRRAATAAAQCEPSSPLLLRVPSAGDADDTEEEEEEEEEEADVVYHCTELAGDAAASEHRAAEEADEASLRPLVSHGDVVSPSWSRVEAAKPKLATAGTPLETLKLTAERHEGVAPAVGLSHGNESTAGSVGCHANRTASAVSLALTRALLLPGLPSFDSSTDSVEAEGTECFRHASAHAPASDARCAAATTAEEAVHGELPLSSALRADDDGAASLAGTPTLLLSQSDERKHVHVHGPAATADSVQCPPDRAVTEEACERIGSSVVSSVDSSAPLCATGLLADAETAGALVAMAAVTVNVPSSCQADLAAEAAAVLGEAPESVGEWHSVCQAELGRQAPAPPMSPSAGDVGADDDVDDDDYSESTVETDKSSTCSLD